MDFFERQDRARTRTRWLVVWFAVAVVAIVATVYLAVLVIFGGSRVLDGQQLEAAGGFALWRPDLLAAVTLSVVVLVGSASLYKIAALRQGGEEVARWLGGRPIDPNTDDLALRRLLNVVEEMAIASGTPVPTVFVLEKETGINAFAAGFSTADAVIGVTRGCVDHLSRDELQGVIAHEFSHILHGDMRLNLRLMGVLHGILVLALAGYWTLRTLRFGGGRRSGGAVAAFALLGLVLMVVGWIGVFFGRLIKSGVSRQREFLADASAVQFTRNPGGLASALKKIGGLTAGSRIRSPRVEEASHLFFGNGLRPSFFGWFSTHPPLEARIRLLEPRWDGEYPAVAAAAVEPPSPVAAASAPQVAPVAAAAVEPALASALAGSSLAPAVASRVGTLDSEVIAHAHNVVASLPASLQRAVREPADAEALLYALLLHPDPSVRRHQLERLEQQAGKRSPALQAAVGRAVQMLWGLGAEQRLPVVDLALPALKQMSEQQYLAFLANVRALASGEGDLRLFEYTVQRILARHLAPHFTGPESTRVAYYSLRGLVTECSTLLSALAWIGGNKRPEAAFAAGLGRLETLDVEMLPRHRCGLADVDQALRRLAQVAPRMKRQLVEAVAECIAFDRRITVEEAELLRAISDSLDCPMPPFLPGEL